MYVSTADLHSCCDGVYMAWLIAGLLQTAALFQPPCVAACKDGHHANAAAACMHPNASGICKTMNASV